MTGIPDYQCNHLLLDALTVGCGLFLENSKPFDSHWSNQSLSSVIELILPCSSPLTVRFQVVGYYSTPKNCSLSAIRMLLKGEGITSDAD